MGTATVRIEITTDGETWRPVSLTRQLDDCSVVVTIVGRDGTERVELWPRGMYPDREAAMPKRPDGSDPEAFGVIDDGRG